jgi:hypothetical protein
MVIQIAAISNHIAVRKVLRIEPFDSFRGWRCLTITSLQPGRDPCENA